MQVVFCSESTDHPFCFLRRGSKSCGLVAGPQKLATGQAEAHLALGRILCLAQAGPSPASEPGQC